MIDKKEDYYIFEGYNHYTNKPLYRVQGNDENDNEYQFVLTGWKDQYKIS